MSADAEIATLAREAPHDPLARYRWRCALVRAGRGAEAGFEVGDEVEVGGCFMFPDRKPSRAMVASEPSIGGKPGIAAHWKPGVIPDDVCSHQEAWTLLTPAKPKGGEA